MSNNHKIISLKKITPKRNNPSTKINEEEKNVSLQMKIDNSKHQLASLEQQKKKLLHELKQTIDREKEEWEETKQREEEEARRSGYETGYNDGKEEALTEYVSKIEEANQIITQATEDYHRTVAKYEEAIITLAVAASRKIIGEELKTDPTLITSIITKAIEELKDHSRITIYVHPKDYPLVIKQKEELEQLMEEDEILSIYPDQQLQQGDCTIKHPFGQIDVGIDTQLRQIKNALEEKLAERL